MFVYLQYIISYFVCACGAYNYTYGLELNAPKGNTISHFVQVKLIGNR